MIRSIIFAVLLSVTCACSMTGDGESSDAAASLVDEKIQAVLSEESYLSADKQERYAIVSALLESLRDGGYIENLSCDQEAGMFSFRYSNGILGGVCISDFSDVDGMPRNGGG